MDMILDPDITFASPVQVQDGGTGQILITLQRTFGTAQIRGLAKAIV